MARSMIDVRYSSVAIAFHWAIALLVIVNLIIGIGHDAVPALRAWMPAHKSIGITVLVLTLARLAWRLGHRSPPLPPRMAAWERSATYAAHWLFYGLLILLPLSGWMMVSSPDRKRPLDWFGLFDIPFLSVSRATAHLGGDAHGILGWSMLALVAIHVAAALRHQFLLRDNLIARMVPGSAR
ncbi:MAG: cytochrome b [Candidatus Sphingomonas colombiensis]|nr:cytochrome b [Sphingomonas sp.]WEK41984.1 MAG: cytochrome b [Sphingomonas sp.]